MKKSKKNKRSSGASTLISQGSQVEGSLHCEADLRIDGDFNGTIESQGNVTIGESAVTRSNISAKEIVIAGKVYGDISAAGKLTITPTGQMYGDVTASSLIIMEGGVLNGASRMEKTPSEKNTVETLPLQRPEAG
ncbi:bactofilin family protein [Paenibacillus sp. DMB20]|uniref:bactofilin family protein n=1 Tax=Paenibacillus sp. DMB20 TaxID=1642570 RepID=UPI0006277D08|nr:polymer-forming cytoskeletal protein [Paenibacillus sp. DMB20]KKO51023.1 cell division protein [Paenibacillus sp. DMB20]